MFKHCRTVLDVCEELETQRTRDITQIILSFAQEDKEVQFGTLSAMIE